MPRILSLTVLILALSCSLGRMDQIAIVFPELPDDRISESNGAWILESREGRGGGLCREVRFVPGRTILIEIPKEVPLVCLLYPPSLSGNFKARPAGGLYVPGETASLELTWPDGAGASFLVDAATGGFDLNRINLRRLMDTIKERGEPDPWQLDWDLLGRQLAENEMRYWYIRKKHSFELAVPFPAGRWQSRSLWLEPLVCTGDVKPVLTLTEGAHSFRNCETEQVYLVVVEDSGEFFTLLY